jgi:hypothetical protein
MPPKRPAHRPPKTLEDRVVQFEQAARAADGRHGGTPGAWFARSMLKAYGIGNPADGWTVQLRTALDAVGVETREQPIGPKKKRWQVRVIHRRT